MSKSLIEKGWFRTIIIIPAFFLFAGIFQLFGVGVSVLFSKLGIIDFSLADLETLDNIPAMTIIQYFDLAGIFFLLWIFMKYVDKEPFKNFRLPSESETKTIKSLVTYLKDLDAKTSSEEIQSIVFKVGKEAGYENLREWFSCLYETALGQSSGPRMGGFIKLYGINKSIKLLEDVLNGNLVK